MSEIPYAQKTEKSYENFVAYCPHCNYKNIYNRVTDLKTTESIDFKMVICLNEVCAKSFAINGDLINPAFQMLIYDCYELRAQKHYSYCILNLTQAFEVFFSLYLKIELLYKPLAIMERTHLVGNERLNDLANRLYEAVKKLSFVNLRNIFLNFVLANQIVTTFDESEKRISELSKLSKKPPSDKRIQDIQDVRLSKVVRNLKNTRINELRNQVVHKAAYRPTLDEVDSAIEETKDILIPLAHLLKIDSDDINVYTYEGKL